MLLCISGLRLSMMFFLTKSCTARHFHEEVDAGEQQRHFEETTEAEIRQEALDRLRETSLPLGLAFARIGLTGCFGIG